MTRRTPLVSALVVVVAGAGAGVWWLVTSGGGSTPVAAVPTRTAAVVRTTLTTTTELSGTLGYQAAYPMDAQLGGTITALPQPGTLVSRGEELYEVDGAAVHLWYGTRPSWRTFRDGMSAGRDVRQLEQNLTALGFGAGLTVDDVFDWATEQAVDAWQAATGQVATGTVELGRVVFEPGPVRVVSVASSLGAPAQPGQPILTASPPQPVVIVPVPVTQTYLLHARDRVTVTLPSGLRGTGRVVSVSPVASSPSDSSNNQGGNGPGGPPQATVPAVITLDRPAFAAGLDEAPVTVAVTDREVNDVLAVPVTALVALAGGGYAVWVDAGGGRHLVAVTPGLFAQTQVQVTAPGLHAGDRVEVPVQ